MFTVAVEDAPALTRVAVALHIHIHDDRDPTGKLSATTRGEIGEAGSAKREDMPSDVFLEPGSKKYPVKEKRDGKWAYTRNLLLAAARRARIEGDEALAKRADSIREREFGGA